MIEAASYYKAQASGQRVDFIEEIEHAVKTIVESPNTYPILEGELKRRLLRRFPFGIL